jgi:hypothetical protein
MSARDVPVAGLEFAAEWALWSKEPGDSRDYRVLRAWPPERATDFGRAVVRYLPGNLPGRADAGPGALPWVTFSGGESAIGVAVMDVTAASDRDGRRIARTRYLRVALDAARVPAYGALAHAALTADLAPDLREPLKLTLAPAEPEAIARRVERLGFDWVAGTAALMIERHVIVTGAGALTMDERIELMEAVLALLPLGLRRDLGASTWTEGGRSARLCFGPRAGGEQVGVVWGRAPDPPAGPGAAYLEALHRLHVADPAAPADQDAAARRTLSAARRLLRAGRPSSFDEADQAVEALAALDRAVTAVRAAIGGADDVVALRAAVDDGVAAELEPHERAAVFAALARAGSAGDLPRLDRMWEPGYWPLLVAGVRREVAELRDPGLLDGLLDLAERGDVETLVAGLVRAPHRGGAAGAGTAHLLRWAGGRLAAGRWEPDRWPAVRDALVASPPAAYAFLEQQLEHRSAALFVAAMAWMERGGPAAEALVRPFRVTQDPASDGGAYDDALREASRHGPDAPLALLDAAALAPPTEHALAAAWRWLTGIWAGLTGAAPGRWADRVMQLADRLAGPRAAAYVDLVALLLRRSQPAPIVDRLAGQSAVGYVDAFRDACRWAPGPVRSTVAASLVPGLTRQTWARSEELAVGLLDVLRELAGGDGAGELGAVTDAVGRGLQERPTLVETAAYRERWQPLEARSPRLRTAAALAGLRIRPLTPHDTARFAAIALAGDAAVQEVVEIVAHRQVLPATAEDFLDALRPALDHEGVSEVTLVRVRDALVHRLGSWSVAPVRAAEPAPASQAPPADARILEVQRRDPGPRREPQQGAALGVGLDLGSARARAAIRDQFGGVNLVRSPDAGADWTVPPVQLLDLANPDDGAARVRLAEIVQRATEGARPAALAIAVPEEWLGPAFAATADSLRRLLTGELPFPEPRLVSAPVCVAAHVARRCRDRGLDVGTVLVCDAGASGFHATVCEVAGGAVRLLEHVSSEDVAGAAAFDRRAALTLAGTSDDPALVEELDRARRTADPDIAAVLRMPEQYPSAGGSPAYRLTGDRVLTIDQVHRLVSPATERIHQTVRSVLHRAAVRGIAMTNARVAIVGGFSRFPPVDRAIRDELGADLGSGHLEFAPADPDDEVAAAACGAVLVAEGAVDPRMPYPHALAFHVWRDQGADFGDLHLPFADAGALEVGAIHPVVLHERGAPFVAQLATPISPGDAIPVDVSPAGDGRWFPLRTQMYTDVPAGQYTIELRIDRRWYGELTWRPVNGAPPLKLSIGDLGDAAIRALTRDR